jgi:O-antigen chain-terminating methyltransferase
MQATDVQSTLGVMHRVTQTLKRELEKESTTGASGLSRRSGEAAKADARGETSSLDSYKYVGFEDRFRGSADDIRGRLEAYVPIFAGASDVLDVGCGRGEFLELLKAKGVSARGVDLNDEMAAVCRERGLEATAGDALGYLQAQADGSLGGLFAAQVVEHLEPGYLTRFLETAYHKLRPGSKIVLETINPACWYAFFSSYIRDITHKQPLHPDTLQFLLSASGFQNVSVRYSAPFPEEAKLQLLLQTPGQMEETFNENVRRLNSLLFTHLDYAAIGERVS